MIRDLDFPLDERVPLYSELPRALKVEDLLFCQRLDGLGHGSHRLAQLLAQNGKLGLGLERGVLQWLVAGLDVLDVELLANVILQPP